MKTAQEYAECILKTGHIIRPELVFVIQQAMHQARKETIEECLEILDPETEPNGMSLYDRMYSLLTTKKETL